MANVQPKSLILNGLDFFTHCSLETTGRTAGTMAIHSNGCKTPLRCHPLNFSRGLDHDPKPIHGRHSSLPKRFHATSSRSWRRPSPKRRP